MLPPGLSDQHEAMCTDVAQAYQKANHCIKKQRAKQGEWGTALESMVIIETRPVIPNLGSPNVLGLQLPEILASTASGEGF